MQQEKDHLAADSVYKHPAQLETEEHLQQYQQRLTADAFPFVKKQDQLSKSIVVREDSQGQSSSRETVTTTTSCSCCFKLSMMLPCQHILAVQKSKGRSLYEEELYTRRWSRKYHHCKQRLFNQEEPCTEFSGVSVTLVIKKPRPQMQQQNYKAVFPLVPSRVGLGRSQQQISTAPQNLEDNNKKMGRWPLCRDLIVQ